MKKFYRVYDIRWDTDGEKVSDLPTEIVIPLDAEGDVEEQISDYLTETYGFCHFGFRYGKPKGTSVTRFVVEIVTQSKDGCGNKINPPTAREVRSAIAKVVDYAEIINVTAK